MAFCKYCTKYERTTRANFNASNWNKLFISINLSKLGKQTETVHKLALTVRLKICKVYHKKFHDLVLGFGIFVYNITFAGFGFSFLFFGREHQFYTFVDFLLISSMSMVLRNKSHIINSLVLLSLPKDPD